MATKGVEGYFITKVQKQYLPMVQGQAEIIKTVSENNIRRLMIDLKNHLYEPSSYYKGTDPVNIKRSLGSFFGWIEEPENSPYHFITVLNLLKNRNEGAAQVFPFDKMNEDTIHLLEDFMQIYHAIYAE